MTKKDKCSVSQKGRIVIHLGDIEKRIYNDELLKYLEQGWEKGVSDKHKIKNSETHKGRTSPNKNKKLSEEQKDKIRETLKQKYKNKDIIVWNKGKSVNSDDRVRKNIDKMHSTKLEKYGTIAPRKKGSKLSEEHKKKISNSHKGKHCKLSPEKLEIKLTKEYITKKLNNSFNKSSSEENFYRQLLEENKNKTILRQYKDNERYPFYCDFYIVEDDLFIELNAHWTHGGRPYDPNSPECQEQLKIWKEKSQTSKFFQNAIQTWTVRDVNKQRIAQENNLNYKVIY